jgi:integrase
MPRTASSSFRIGKVQVYLRGRIWYLCYHENGQRRRPRVGSDGNAARRLAAQTNAQLESGDVTVLGFEPLRIPDLRQRWLDHHEHVLRSSVNTVNRYRTATDHLLTFVRDERPVRVASNFSARDAEAFVRHLRTIEVTPNGHANSRKRRLLDKGVTFIAECCRALFVYAAKRRHLSAYAENPFSAIGANSIPVEDAKPIVLFTPGQERQFLEACNDRQFPIFLTLLLTGLRPGELCHLLLPDDLDLTAGLLHVRNKPRLGWQIKTRAERSIPLIPALNDVLRFAIGTRRTGPVFRQARCERRDYQPVLENLDAEGLAAEALRRAEAKQQELRRGLSRCEHLSVLRTVWRDVAALKEDRVRCEFIRLARSIGLRHATAPKALRHLFATSLQETNVDPLVRNLLMGHASGQGGRAGGGLGMTAVYTHTQAITIRRQLDSALGSRASTAAALQWLRDRGQMTPPPPANEPVSTTSSGS